MSNRLFRPAGGRLIAWQGGVIDTPWGTVDIDPVCGVTEQDIRYRITAPVPAEYKSVVDDEISRAIRELIEQGVLMWVGVEN